MPKRLVALNVFLGAFAVVFAVLIGREIAFPRRLPPPPEPRLARVAAAPVVAARPAPEALSAYDVIVSRHLFNPARSDRVFAVDAAMPVGGRPFLYGVVVDGFQSRAYLQDPVTQHVRGYQIGDAINGWRLEKIGEDRVIMIGPETGRFEVPLRDPAKPRGAPPAAAPLPEALPPLSTPAAPSRATPSPAAAPPTIQGPRTELPPGVPQGIPPQLVRPGGLRGEGK
jgi:hypothetical protein